MPAPWGRRCRLRIEPIHCVAAGLCTSWLIASPGLIGSLTRPYTIIIVLFHVLKVFRLTPDLCWTGCCLNTSLFLRCSALIMDSTAVKIQALGDLELAVLLCLVAQQHCIISTNNLLLDSLAHELQLVCLYLPEYPHLETNKFKIATNIFGLSCALVNCSSTTTLDAFKESILVDVPDAANDHVASSTHLSLPSFNHTTSRHTFFRNHSGTSNELDERKIADIIIAKDLNMASSNVQTQALEVFTYPSYGRTSCLTILLAHAYQKTVQSHRNARYLQALPLSRATRIRVQV